LAERAGALQQQQLLLVAEENVDYQQQREPRSQRPRALAGRGFERAAPGQSPRRRSAAAESLPPVVDVFRS